MDSNQLDLFAQSPSVSETNFAGACFKNIGPTSQSTQTSKHSTTAAGAMSSQAATPAKKIAEQTQSEMGKACGPTRCDKYEGSNLFTLFEKMFLETSKQGHLAKLKVNLTKQVTTCGLTLYMLRPWVRLTIDPGRGRWPTPTAQDAKNATMPPSQAHRNNGSIPCLLARMGFVGWVLNPQFYEELMMYPIDYTELSAWGTASTSQSLKKLEKPSLPQRVNDE